MRGLRHLYGREHVKRHLAAMLVTYGVAAYAVWAIFQNARPWTVLLWLGGAIVLHDFAFLPLYTAAYRAARRLGGAQPSRRSRVIALQHVAVPLMISALLFLAWLPLILELSERNYRPTTGMTEEPYLVRWLAATGALFAMSAALWAIRRRRLLRSGPQASSG